MPTFGGGGEPCVLCNKAVYPAEKLKTTSEHVFHKDCFRCTKCNCLLKLASYCEDAVTGRVYCAAHYKQLATEAGIGAAALGGIDATASVIKRQRKAAELREDCERVAAGSAVWVDAAAEGVSAAVAAALGGGESPFVQAEVSAVDGETVRVRKKGGGGGEHSVPLAAVGLADLGDARLNNLQLLHLNEPNLLYNVRRRFGEGRIYTWTGQLELLAVNPYERLDLYSEEQMRAHADGDPDAQPHTFAVAERVYRALIEGREPQSVVVSGESGAGKTETNKHLIGYLRWREARAGGAAAGERISRALTLSSVVLEALGNAKTTNNNNSSRFGKYLEVLFDPAAGTVAGATFRIFRLEKSRVARQARSRTKRRGPASDA
jgi:hypothetical protein